MWRSIIEKLELQKFEDVVYKRLFVTDYLLIDDNPTVETIKGVILDPKTGIETRQNNTMDVIIYLLTKCSPTFISEIISSFGFKNLADTIDVFYNLLWYINRFPDPFATGLSDEEISYVSGLNVKDLLSLFPNIFPRDILHNKAELLYSLISGKTIPLTVDHNGIRYQEVSKYPPNIIGKILQIRFNYGTSPKKLPPYEEISSKPEDEIEHIFLVANTQNLQELMEKYGVLLSPMTPNAPDARLDNFLSIISNYRKVFDRPANIPPPPNINLYFKAGMHRLSLVKLMLPILMQYTVIELLDAYEPINSWREFRGLVSVIIREFLEHTPFWSWRHRYCKNDDTDNLTEFEPHGNMNKDDPNNPTLSYGIQGNYKCYQVKELIEMFTQYPGEFKVPDYHPGNMGVDPTTGVEYAETFSIEGIKQLKVLLLNPPDDYRIYNLLTLIDEGLVAHSDDLISNMRDEYLEFTREQQDIIKLYIAWVFLYGMWMRFWEGPGHPWPYNTKNQGCMPSARDEHIFIQNNIYQSLRNYYYDDPMLTHWINSLPIVDYNFRTNEFHIKPAPLIQILEGYLVGNYCMGYGGDMFTQTGYYLITHLLKLDSIDTFISEMLPTLLALEQQIVNEQLNPQGELLTYINTMNSLGEPIQGEILEKYRVLTERQDALNAPTQPLPIFEPSKMTDNKHVDRF